MKLPVPSPLRRSPITLPLAALFLTFTLIFALLMVAGTALGQTDETPPTVESAEVDRATLTLTFSETLKATSTSELKYALSANGVIEGGGVSPSHVSISGNTLTLILGNGAKAGDTVTVNYDAGGTTEKLQDPAGNLVASFTGQQVRATRRRRRNRPLSRRRNPHPNPRQRPRRSRFPSNPRVCGYPPSRVRWRWLRTGTTQTARNPTGSAGGRLVRATS